MKRPKNADEMTRDELEAVKWGGDLPVVDDDDTLRAAGLDPATREPLETAEATRKRISREEELEDAEAKTVEDWDREIRERRSGTGSV